MARYYPVFLNIQDKKCVVVGGGNIAWRKVCSLKEAGAKVTVVSPDFCPELEREAGVERVQQKYDTAILKGAALVVASTDDGAVNKRVYSDAIESGILVNVVDKPDLCSFIVPASIQRGDLCISISTGGASPALARNIRECLEGQFGEEYDAFTKLLSEMRRKMLSEIKDDSIRRDILQRIAGFDILEIMKQDGVPEAKKKIMEIVSEKMSGGT
ncbi:MAG: siroheme synthase [Candidatus Brocadia sp. WS118]|nr:MAG: siroheme synthase [Candidatus Brocadia sp. WS118]